MYRWSRIHRYAVRLSVQARRLRSRDSRSIEHQIPGSLFLPLIELILEGVGRELDARIHSHGLRRPELLQPSFVNPEHDLPELELIELGPVDFEDQHDLICEARRELAHG